MTEKSSLIMKESDIMGIIEGSLVVKKSGRVISPYHRFQGRISKWQRKTVRFSGDARGTHRCVAWISWADRQ